MSDKEPPHPPTTREYFAGIIFVAGLNAKSTVDVKEMCETAVQIADQLIKELNK